MSNNTTLSLPKIGTPGAQRKVSLTLDAELAAELDRYAEAYKAQSARSCDFGHVEEQRLNMAIYQARSCPPIS